MADPLVAAKHPNTLRNTEKHTKNPKTHTDSPLKAQETRPGEKKEKGEGEGEGEGEGRREKEKGERRKEKGERRRKGTEPNQNEIK